MRSGQLRFGWIEGEQFPNAHVDHAIDSLERARDLEQRIATHNAGKGARYTRSRLPVRLVWSEPARDRSTASQREAQIKSMGRNAKLALI